MPKAPLTVLIADAYKDGVVFYKEATSISLLDLVDVYDGSGQNLNSHDSSNGQQLNFTLVSGFPAGYSLTGSVNHLSVTNENAPSPNADVYNASLETSSSASTGTYNGLVKVDHIFTSDPIDFQNNGDTESYERVKKLATAYFWLKIIVEDVPVLAITPPSPPTIIRNGDLLMDVGVAQNIKVTFNSVYQTIYTRVTGLPAGMRYTGSPDGFLSGSISGTPLASGDYNVTITTSYKTSETSETINTSKTVVYTVNEANDPAILLSSQNLTVGSSVNIKLRASDASAILTWSATGLPAGLVCGTGVSAAITGTPTTAGTFSSTITLSCRKINSSETFTVTNPVTFTVT
jgi:hypothetical protein